MDQIFQVPEAADGQGNPKNRSHQDRRPFCPFDPEKMKSKPDPHPGRHRERGVLAPARQPERQTHQNRRPHRTARRIRHPAQAQPDSREQAEIQQRLGPRRGAQIQNNGKAGIDEARRKRSRVGAPQATRDPHQGQRAQTHQKPACRGNQQIRLRDPHQVRVESRCSSGVEAHEIEGGRPIHRVDPPALEPPGGTHQLIGQGIPRERNPRESPNPQWSRQSNPERQRNPHGRREPGLALRFVCPRTTSPGDQQNQDRGCPHEGPGAQPPEGTQEHDPARGQPQSDDARSDGSLPRAIPQLFGDPARRPSQCAHADQLEAHEKEPGWSEIGQRASFPWTLRK